MNYLILIIVAGAGVALGAYVTRRKTAKTFVPRSERELGDMRAEAREALDERTEERKKKILDLMGGVAVHQEELRACNVADIPNQPGANGQSKKGITTENVEKLLGVSSQTARKYLNELESEKKIEQIGNSGRGVYYTLSA